MATIQPAVLTPSAPLSNTAAAIYTTPTAGRTVVRRAVFTNTDTSPRTITVHRVPLSGSAVTANVLIQARRLAPGEAYVAPELASMVLNGGDAIFAAADVAGVVNVTMSGFTA